MRVRVLGNGDFTSDYNTSFIIEGGERSYLVDCPKNYKEIPDIEDIGNVILTHLHPDHLGDLETFLTIKRERYGQEVSLYTTKEIFNDLKTISELTITPRIDPQTTDSEPVPLEDYVNFVNLRYSDKLSINGLEFELRKNIHSLPTFGFTISDGESKLFYSSDTCYDIDYIEGLLEKGIIDQGRRDDLIEFGMDADMIIHEATNRDSPVHTDVGELEKLSEGKKSRLYLAHIPDGMETDLNVLEKGGVYQI